MTKRALLAMLIAVVTFAHAAATASLLSPINCASGPSLSIASVGEYVWNCSSSSAGGGDVLRIVVPSPPTVNASRLLSVEVRVSTFQQIIVDLGNVVRPQSNVNVTIVLCGAPLLGSAAINVLNLTDRPLTPAITITGSSNSSAPSSDSTTLGHGVLVAVVVDRDVQLWMRNVLGLVVVEPLSTNNSQLLDVTLELRSGCVVELHDVRYFVLIDSDSTRFVFSGFNATIQSTIAMPTSSSVAVLSVNASGGGGGSIDVGLTLCNVSIVQLASPDASFLLVLGDAVSMANVTVAFTRCNISIPSPMGTVVAVRGNFTSTVTNLSVTCQDTIVYCDRSIVSISAVISIDAIDVAVIVRSSIVTVRVGALFGIQSSNASVALHRVTATVERGSTLVFIGQGFLIFTLGGKVSGNYVATAVRSSSMTVGGDLGALFDVKSPNGAIILLNVTAAVEEGSVVSFVGEGYLIFAIGVVNASASCIAAAVHSSNVTGSRAALVDVESPSGSVVLSNVTSTVEGGSIVSFVGEGQLVYALSVNTASASNVAATVYSSCVTMKSFGALCYIESSNKSVVLLNVTAVVEGGSTVDVSSEGYLVFALGVTSSASGVFITVRSSNVSTLGSKSALFGFESRGSFVLVNVNATVEGGSNIYFLGRGYIIFSSGVGIVSARRVFTTVLSSNVIVGGNIGALFYIESFHGIVLLSNTSSTVGRGSTAYFVGRGYLGFALGVGDVSVNYAVATVVSGNMTVNGNSGAVFHVESSSGSVFLTNIKAGILGSTVCFNSQGYVGLALSIGNAIASDVLATVSSSNVTVRGMRGVIFDIESSTGNVLLANVTIAVDGNSTVIFVGAGYVGLVVGVRNASAHCVVVAVVSSRVMVRGTRAGLFDIESPNGSVLAVNVTVVVSQGSAVRFSGRGFLFFALAVQSTADGVTVIVSSSSIIVDGSFGALFDIQSSNGTIFLLNASVTADSGSSVSCFGQGYLVFALSIGSCSASAVAIAVGSSNVTVGGDVGALVLLNGSTVAVAPSSLEDVSLLLHDSRILFAQAGRVADVVMSATSSTVMRIVIDHSVLLVSEVTRSISSTECFVALHQSTIVVTGPFLLADVSPALLLLTITNSLLIASTPISKLYISPPSRGTSNVTLLSSCGLIGWHNNNSSIAWTLGVGDTFFSGRLGDMPLPVRALRKLDVVGADRVAVSAERCAWGRGSHEFRATDSATESTSSSPSRSLDDATMTLLPSVTLSWQQLAVVKRSIVTVRGIGSSVLFVSAASSVVSSSVSTVVPGIQAIGQRSAVRRLCDAYNAADSTGAVTVPPLSDPASDPFGVTIGVLGDELMYAGGSVVSSLLLALIYAAVVLVVVPLLRGPREWLRRVKTAPLTALRLPGSLYAPLALVLQPLTAAAVVLLVSSSRSTGPVVFGLLLFVATIAPLCALLWRVWDGRRQQLLLWRAASKATHHDQGSLGRVVRTLTTAFGDKYECVPRSSHESASQRHFERYGVVVASYAAGREWFVGVEVAITVVSGALSGVASGLDPSVVCSASVMDGFNWTLAALCIVLLAAVVVLRPYSSHFENVQCGLSSLLAAVCLALQSLSPESPAIAAITWVQSALGFLPLLLLPLPSATTRQAILECSNEGSTIIAPTERWSAAVRVDAPMQTTTIRSPQVSAIATGQRRTRRRLGTARGNLAAIIEAICANRPLLSG